MICPRRPCRYCFESFTPCVRPLWSFFSDAPMSLLAASVATLCIAESHSPFMRQTSSIISIHDPSKSPMSFRTRSTISCYTGVMRTRAVRAHMPAIVLVLFALVPITAAPQMPHLVCIDNNFLPYNSIPAFAAAAPIASHERDKRTCRGCPLDNLSLRPLKRVPRIGRAQAR